MKRRVLNIVITGAIIIVSFVLQSYLSLVSGQSFVVPNLLLIVTSIFGIHRGVKLWKCYRIVLRSFGRRGFWRCNRIVCTYIHVYRI